MKYLYLDNFRGFQAQSVPLADVNFLVGENSSGKTSLMTMLREFHPERFGMSVSQGFRAAQLGDDAQFGHYAELVSAHSQDQSYFRLGYVGEERRSKEEIVPEAILITYKKVDGIPQISRLTCTTPKGETSLDFDDKDVYARFVEASLPKDCEAMHKRLLEWASEHHQDRGSGWSKVDISNKTMPLPFILSLATAMKEDAKDGGVQFILPPMAPPIVWIAPIRSRPERIYDQAQSTFSSEGDHTPYVIKRLLESKTESKGFTSFMKDVGASSGLFQKIAVKHWGGRTETSPFEVDVYLDNKALALNSVGYGVSQSLPILVELFEKRRGRWFSIQQPEVHLHPRAQAALGDLFFQMAVRENKRFLIETHSDFTIDRFRLNYRNGGKQPKSQILFFQRKDKHNVVTPIPIEMSGELSASQPEAYRQFFIREELNMLGIQ